MKNYHISLREWGECVGVSFQISEFDLKSPVTNVFDSCSDLPLCQAPCRHVMEECYNIHQFHDSSYATKQVTRRGKSSPTRIIQPVLTVADRLPR